MYVKELILIKKKKAYPNTSESFAKKMEDKSILDNNVR